MNDKVTLTIVRDGHTMDLEVMLNQEESSSSSSNKQEQNEQNNGGNGQDQQATARTVTAADYRSVRPVVNRISKSGRKPPTSPRRTR